MGRKKGRKREREKEEGREEGRKKGGNATQVERKVSIQTNHKMTQTLEIENKDLKAAITYTFLDKK